MSAELRHALEKMERAAASLREGAVKARSRLEKDGAIQRFEFTFEVFWKGIKVILEDEGLVCKTPKDCLQAAFRIGLIEDEGLFLRILKDRNRMSHIYGEKESKAIFHRIKKKYASGLAEALYALTPKVENRVQPRVSRRPRG